MLPASMDNVNPEGQPRRRRTSAIRYHLFVEKEQASERESLFHFRWHAVVPLDVQLCSSSFVLFPLRLLILQPPPCSGVMRPIILVS